MPLILLRLAVSNVFASALNVLVGLVLLFGTALLVVGGSLFSTLDNSLSKSIVDSVTGHLQIYNARSKDPLEIYGKVDGSDSNLTPIDDFKALKAKLLKVPNVDKVVPMGGATALVGSGNTIDVTLEKLRALYREQADPAHRLPPEAFALKRTSLFQHVRNMVAVLTKDVERESELTDGSSIEPSQREALALAATDAFWADFDATPFDHLELLENRVAPLVADADLLFLRCLGTDLTAYQQTFSRMVIVEGGPVPEGHRGVLLPRFFVEEYLKLKNARRLDKIRDALEAGRKLSDPTDKDLQRFVRENQSQTREIVLQLDGEGTAAATTKLQALLGSPDTDLAALLSRFFLVTDDNFAERYAFFYRELAPLLSLYRAKIGDQLTLRSFGRSGSTMTVLLTVYGVFELRGLEKSPIAGANALVDMVSFRDLYGYLSADKKAELDAMKASVNARQMTREDAESALFSDEGGVVEEAHATPIEVGALRQERQRQQNTFDPTEIDDGVVLHAALVLKDGSDLAQAKTLADIERLSAESKPEPDRAAVSAARALVERGDLPFALSAALSNAIAVEEARLQQATAPNADQALLDLQAALKSERPVLNDGDVASIVKLLETARPKTWVVGWGTAAGFFGKFIDFFRVLLGAVIAAFAFIALIVVTLGVTIATLQRTQTLGTMRAIGAQRWFVLALVMSETVMLALSFGGVGALIGAGIVKYLWVRGIPAFKDELYFFFSGPVLRPELTIETVALSLFVTLGVSLVAVIVPVVMAIRVAPITAMQASE